MTNSPFQFNFQILKDMHSPIVLSLDWLQHYNPNINWKKLTIKLEINKPTPQKWYLPLKFIPKVLGESSDES